MMRVTAFIAVQVAVVLAGCDRDPVSSRPADQSAPRAADLVEVVFSNIGTANFTVNARVANELTVPGHSDGPGDATIQLDSVLAGQFTYTVGDTTFRYLQATYRVRNAQRGDQRPFDTPRRNLTFVAVSTARTIGQTPVLRLLHADGSPADPALALQFIPTGLAFVENDGSLGSAFADVLQVFTEDEIADIAAPATVTNIFPYGFVVRRTGSSSTRDLPASPAAGQFDGIINVAYRIPVQANAADNPSTIAVMLLALDDAQTRISQSLEEQTASGRTDFRDRAAGLNATIRNLLPGGTLPGDDGARTLCSVRTAGFPGAALAHITNVAAALSAFTPEPHAADGSGSFIAANTSIRADFTQAVQGADSRTMPVIGMLSGLQFQTVPYTGNGTASVATPAGAFYPGEEVQVTVTTALICPQSYVARWRVATLMSSGTFSAATAYVVGAQPASAAVGDLNDDGNLDVVVTNRGSNSVSVLLGNGDGTLQAQRTFAAGAQPGAIEALDADGDGDVDVLVTNPGELSLLRGNGDGTLGSRTPIGDMGNLSDVDKGDINGDGIMDLVMSDTRGTVRILLGEGAGTYVKQPFVPPATREAALVITDANLDGRLDVASSKPDDDAFIVRLGDGTGVLQSGPLISAGDNPAGIAAGDMNRDGRPDLVVANMGESTVAVFLNSGGGAFQLSARLASATTPRTVAVGDVNGDGRLDVVAGGSGGFSLFVGIGDGSLQAEQVLSTADVGHVLLVDLDDDGILEVVATNEVNAGRLIVLRGLP